MSPVPERPSSSIPLPIPGAVAAAARAAAQRGPETVVNPEGRPSPVLLMDQAAPPTSGVVRILFPTVEDPEAERSAPTAAGLQLGHFTIIDRIRNGGMGAVFRALDTRLNRVVALKVLPPAQSRDGSAVQRFRNEAQAAAQLDHENIARVFYIGEDQGLHFIAFEFVTGTNVRDVIAQQGRLPVAEAVSYTLQMASALLHTSAQGVIHRDIKPSNIIITPGGRAKLVDLGLARQETREGAGVDLTMAGTTLGTFDYISPEQARDPRSADVRSDIYSLGCTLYHMLTGEPPYPEGTVLQKLLQHQGDDAPDPALKNPNVPENLSAIARKMMAKDLRRRYQTAEQLVRDLMLVAGALGLRSLSPEGLVWMTSQTAQPQFWERHLAWIATVSALFLIVGYLEFGAGRGPAAQKRPTDPGSAAPAGRSVAADPMHPDRSHPAAPSNSSAQRGEPPVDRVAPAQPASTIAATGTTAPARLEPTAITPVPHTATTLAQVSGAGAVLAGGPARTEFAAVQGARLGPTPDDFGDALRPAPFAADVLTSLGPNAAEAVRAAAAPLRPASDGLGAGRGATGQNGPGPGAEQAVGDGNSNRPRVEVVTTAPVAPAAEIFIVDADGAPGPGFSSLEAACSMAKDGNIIEIRRQGRFREKPIKVTRTMTIRAGRGYKPVVEFVPEQTSADRFPPGMITVSSGALDLAGVGLVMTVSDAADQWNLFAVQRPDAIRLQGVAVTLVNPKQRAAAVFAIQTAPGPLMPEIDLSAVQPRPPLGIELSDCLVRGGGHLFAVKSLEPARLSVKDCVLALAGSILAAQGSMEPLAENAQLELRLDHVTAALAGCAVELASGEMPRKLLPVQVSASNCIFSLTTRGPLVGMSGHIAIQDFRALLSWNGRKNYYDRLDALWSVVSTDGIGKTELLDFSGWQKYWYPAVEADAQNHPITWQRDWAAKPFAEMTPADFTLDREAPRNHAVSGATKGRDAGADLTAVPRPKPDL